MNYIYKKYKNLTSTYNFYMVTKLDKTFENDFLRVPRPFVRKFGLKTAILLSELYSEYTYWKDRNLLEQGGWFYSTIENMAHNTGLSKSQQLQACKKLQEYGIIKVKYHGLPKKRYFKFNMAALDKLYDDFKANLGKQKEVIELDESSKTDAAKNTLTTERKLNTDDSDANGNSIMDTQTRVFTGFSF